MPEKFSIRSIESSNDLKFIAELQELVWGAEGRIPIPLMLAMIKNGGIIVAAVEEISGLYSGFCLGFSGQTEEGDNFLYSHMLAIHPQFRNKGLGTLLKIKQREVASDKGYSDMKWTFDPLEIRNGYLNICKLGGNIEAYKPNYYGYMDDKINKGLPSDRFILSWDCQTDLKTLIELKQDQHDHWKNYSPALTWHEQGEFPIVSSVSINEKAFGLLVPIPVDIEEMKTKCMEEVIKWRECVRSVMLKLLQANYKIVGVHRSDTMVNYYVLEKLIKVE